MYASPPASAASEPRPMTNEELLTQQLYLHQQIQKQMQMQMEMTRQLNHRQSLTSSIAKVEPDLGDNVFDMLDDLIMIPSGAVASERTSLSKSNTASAMDVDGDNGSCSTSRDSLADIMESLDMDLDDFDTEIGGGSRETTALMDEARDSFDDDVASSTSTLDAELDALDAMNDPTDHGVDDDDDDDGTLDPANVSYMSITDPDEPAIGIMGRRRVSSADMLASMTSNGGSVSMNGNLCTLIWEDGLLGLRLRMSHSRMLPAVSKITGRSSIFGIHLVDVGDLLMEIGDRSTREMEFIEAINYLKEVPKPCKLVFRRLNSDPMAVKPVQPEVKSEIALKLVKKFEELAAAESEKTVVPPTPTIRLDAKYEVQWIDGPLGISLIASKDVPYPLVTRITGKNRSPQVQDVQPGHYLLQIGTYNTADGNFNSAIKYLQKVTKPVALVFCPGLKAASVRPEVAPDEYDHVWEKKQALCFTVRPDPDGRIVVADLGSVKSFKTKGKGGPNLAAFVNSGDYIVWINDECTRDMTFHEALLKLRTAKRPLVIRFKKGPPDAPVDIRSPQPVAVPEPPVSSIPPPPPPSLPLQPSQSQPTSTKSSTRTFNPLKKIVSLGSSHAKENSAQAANQQISDTTRKLSHPLEPSLLLQKKSSDPELKRSESLPQPSTENTPDASTLVPPPTQTSSKVINLEALNNLRLNKTSTLVKSASDPVNRSFEDGARDPAAPSPPASTGATSDEYEVVWPEGTSLGLTLRVHPTTRFPVVARVTGTSNLKNIEHVSPGDILFAANNVPIVPQPKFKQTLENLSKLPKPAVLRFRRAQSTGLSTKSPDEINDMALPRGPPLKENEYELIWRENANLGLVFSSDADVPRVTKVDLESGGPMLHRVALGDALTGIGAMEIAGMTFHTSMATLRATKRPIVLRFRR